MMRWRSEVAGDQNLILALYFLHVDVMFVFFAASVRNLYQFLKDPGTARLSRCRATSNSSWDGFVIESIGVLG